MHDFLESEWTCYKSDSLFHTGKNRKTRALSAEREKKKLARKHERVPGGI